MDAHSNSPSTVGAALASGALFLAELPQHWLQSVPFLDSFVLYPGKEMEERRPAGGELGGGELLSAQETYRGNVVSSTSSRVGCVQDL